MVQVVVALLKTTERFDSRLLALVDLRALLETRLLLRTATEALPRKRLATTSDCCSWLVVASMFR
jgi:hypothetical protein